MKKVLKTIAVASVCAVMACTALAFTACGNKEEEETGDQTTLNLADVSWTYKDSEKYGVQYYQTLNVWYCSNPVTIQYQTLNIYVPAAYMNADGSLIAGGKCGDYTTETAPILFVNSVGGYSGYMASTYTITQTTADDNYIPYVGHGCVVVFMGERGRNTTGTDGSTGQAPESLIDLKAGIRYLKHNAQYLAGDINKIISIGTSAGGNMSALIGTTGNTDIYDSELEKMGAFMDVTDDVYAAQCFCPITDLSHADMAYEWMFNSDYYTEQNINSDQPNANYFVDDNGFSKALSSVLASNYVDYINGLELSEDGGETTLTFDEGGRSGSMYDWLMSKIEDAATIYLSGLTSTERSEYLSNEKNYVSDWLSYDETTGTASISKGSYTSELDAMVYSGYRSRYKDTCAFDALTLDTAECNVFADGGIMDYTHFSQPTTEAIASLKDSYSDAYDTYYQAYYDGSHNEDVIERVAEYNPFNYINDTTTTKAQHFRIRLGTQDADTSFMISATLALELEMAGIDVDYGFVWDQPHTNADRSGEFMDWVDSICLSK